MRRDPVTRAAVAIWLSCCVAVAACAFGRPPSWVAIAIACAFLPYGLLLALGFTPERRTLLALVGSAGALAVFAPSALSDDLFRFLWDGRVLLSGVDPYAHAPDSPALVSLRDAYWASINHEGVATIYPPLAQLLFASLAWVSDPRVFKGVALLFHLALAAWLHRRSARFGFAYGANPLALFECALGGHIDVWVGFALVFAAVSLRDERPWRAALGAVAATGLKLVGLLVLPALFRRRAAAALLAAVMGALMLWPLANAGHGDEGSDRAGMTHYAGRWRGNGALFRGLEMAMGSAAQGIYGVEPGRLEVPGLERLEGTALDPWRAYEQEKKPVGQRAFIATEIFGGWLARLSLMLGIGLFAVIAAWRWPPMQAVRNTLLIALLFAPQVHPWYLLWLLPLDLMVGSYALLVWSAAALMAYVPLDLWIRAREWQDQPWLAVLQSALVLLVLWLERNRNELPRNSAPAHS